MPVVLYPTIIRFPLERANGIQVAQTCHALARLGSRVILFVLKDNNKSTEECLNFYGLKPVEGLHVIRMPFLKSRNARVWDASAYLSCFLHLVFFSIKVKNPVIFTRDLILAQLFLPWIRLRRMKIIYECHHIEYIFNEELPVLYCDTKPLSLKKLERIKKREKKVYEGVSGIIAITQALKEMLIENFPQASPIEVIRDGCVRVDNNDEMPCQQPKPRDESKTLLYVGDLSQLKGVDVLIRAVKHVSNVLLMIVGGLPFEKGIDELKDLSRRMDVQDKVRFLGYVASCKVKELYREADIVLLPLIKTKQNTFFTSPLKLFEYMAYRKPIIAADLHSIREVLSNGETAILVSPDDELAWAEAILKLLSDDALSVKISNNAFHKSLEFTWEQRAENIVHFINKLDNMS